MTTTMENRYWDGDTERMAPVGQQVRTAVPPRAAAPEQGYDRQRGYEAQHGFSGERRYGYDGASAAVPPAARSRSSRSSTASSFAACASSIDMPGSVNSALE